MEMSLVDFSFAAMDSQQRSMAFCMIYEFKQKPDLLKLQQGAEMAFRNFPTSACRIDGYDWVADGIDWKLSHLKVGHEHDLDSTVERYVNEGFNLSQERGIKQAVVECKERFFLVTKFHHALGDGLSCLLWLKVQLNLMPVTSAKLELKDHPKPVKNSIYATKTPSHSFGHLKTMGTSPIRDWSTLEFDPNEIDFKALPFTYNDLMSAVLMKSMGDWSQEQKMGKRRLSLYVPVNVRKKTFEGFGNGCSRIKIYETGTNFFERSLKVREQVRWCKDNGTWKMPTDLSRVRKIPAWLSKILLKLYSKMPKIDMGSIVFSHVESVQDLEDVFTHFKSIKSIPQLYHKYSLGIGCLSFEGKTTMTLAWDKARFQEGDIQKFSDLIRKNWNEAKAEFSVKDSV